MSLVSFAAYISVCCANFLAAKQSTNHLVTSKWLCSLFTHLLICWVLFVYLKKKKGPRFKSCYVPDFFLGALLESLLFRLEIAVPCQEVVWQITPVKLTFSLMGPKNLLLYLAMAISSLYVLSSAVSATGDYRLQNDYVPLVGLKLKALLPGHCILEDRPL